jgi:dTDP-4-amino-4,6-dideoxygalactose transaminase
MKVPFANLAEQYFQIKPEVDEAIQSILSGGSFVGGKPVQKFETEFSKLCGAKNCVGVGNATDALFLSLKALGIGLGDEVITPAWSWISTAEVISLTGAKPVFVDIDPYFFTVTAEAIKEKISSNTKAVIIVHLYGQPAEAIQIKALCRKKNLFLIEDCSQAHLSSENGTMTGTLGDFGVFSFYPTKNLGAYGDAGCLITDQDELAIKVRHLANHGGLSKDEHLMEGTNSRLDTLQAEILTVKLKHLPAWNNKRIKNAQLYLASLSVISDLTLPKIRERVTHTFHQFVIKVKRRTELQAYLNSKGVQTMIHYPKALPFEPAYNYLNHTESDFPVSAQLQNEVLSLPVHPELSQDQILYVCDMIKSFYGIN